MDISIHFPRGFLWGTATAAHQVEGGNTNNNWFAWEEAGHTQDRSGLACDWWNGRWKEDMDRAAEGAQNAHRFSVEWSRIEPEPGRWDETALEKYRAMARGMTERGLKPIVTLHHFTDPLWLYEQDGWENENAAPLFENFTRKVVEALKEYVSLWITINEPNVYALSGYVTGDFPTGKSGHRGMAFALRVLANMLRGHAAAYRAIHQIQPEAQVGYALHYRPMLAARPWFPPDVWMRHLQYQGINLAFPSALSAGVMKSPLGSLRLPEVKGLQDFVGLNYYAVDSVRFDLAARSSLFGKRYYPANADLSETGFIANTPQGLFDSVEWAVKTFPNTPIYITENGVEDSRDSLRPRYLAGHLAQLWRAVNFNYPVRGYLHWSLVDNFEWERGWSQRFGLWGLDTATQARLRRRSVDFYAEICRENGLTETMLKTYCPEALQTIFPGL